MSQALEGPLSGTHERAEPDVFKHHLHLLLRRALYPVSSATTRFSRLYKELSI